MKLLLLPGMDGTGRLFEPLLPFLQGRVEPQVVSFPGHVSRSYSDLLREIPLPAGELAILAESFSGPLGIQLAVAHPEKVKALILVATFARSPSRLGSALKPFSRVTLFNLGIVRNLVCAALTGRFGGDLNERIHDALRTVSPDVLAARLREVLSVDVRDRLKELRLPVLYLRGRKDFVVGPGSLRDFQLGIRNLRIESLDSFHLVLQQQPKQAAACILEFLAGSCQG